jgi:hypothetical protein
MAEHTTTNYKIHTSGPSYMTNYYKVTLRQITSTTELINLEFYIFSKIKSQISIYPH